MQNEDPQLLWTRRQWLSKASVGALAGAAAVGLPASAAVPPAGDDLGARVYNVHAFGAKGDGVTLDTTSLQRAIDACASDGGGTVLLPAGRFLVGSVELKSNVTLHIA